MTTQATYDDVNLILKLYELRREERIRKARDWFARHFQAKNMEELGALCPLGSEENASFRMVTSYWEMVASFVTAGVLHEELLFQNGGELLLVWARTGHLAPAFREMAKNPNVWRNLETVATSFKQWMNRTNPEAYAAFAARINAMVAAPKKS